MLGPRSIKHWWRRQHIGNRALSLGGGYLDRDTLKYHAYSEISPNLVMVGAQKSGTSSLAHYLSLHPDIHLSTPVKEPLFYIFDEWGKQYFEDKGVPLKNRVELLKKKMLSGYSGQRYFLDASTRYTLSNVTRQFGLPERLAKANAKVIYLVRNPFSRMVSSFKHFYSDGAYSNLSDCVLSDQSLLATSLYGYQIAPYLERLGNENVLVLVFEDFVKDVDQSLDQICDFLSIDRFRPYENYPVLNQRESEPLLFSADAYSQVFEKIESDMQALERILERPTNWDLTKETWVENTIN